MVGDVITHVIDEMKITDVKINLIQLDGKRPRREMFVIPGQIRAQFDRRAHPGTDPQHLALIRVLTDAGIEGWCTAFYTFGPARPFAETWLDAFKPELVGVAPSQVIQVGPADPAAPSI